MTAAPVPPAQSPIDAGPWAAKILEHLRELPPGASRNPQEVAQAIAGDDWRRAFAEIKLTGGRLADRGELQILRKGKVVEAAEARGVLRWRLPPR